MIRVALARVLLARLLGGSLSQGSPLWLAVLRSNGRQNRGREVFLLQRKKFLGSSLAPYSSSKRLGDLLRLLRITSQVLGVIHGCDVLRRNEKH